LNSSISPYFLLFLSLLCFAISAILKRQVSIREKKTTQESFKHLYAYLSNETIETIPSYFHQIDLLAFYEFCLKQKKWPSLSPILESRWTKLSQEFPTQQNLFDFFCHSPLKMQKKIVLSFGIFPLWDFQALCLSWIIREKKSNLLHLALQVWASLPYDAPWAYTWLALAFIEEWDKELITHKIHPYLTQHLEASWSFSDAFSSAKVKKQDIQKAFVSRLAHHNLVFQDLGIYGLGFFQCSSALNALLDKLHFTDKNRLSLQLRSIAKLKLPESLKQVADWAININYPNWELMEEVIHFYQFFGSDGDYWINHLKTMDHYIWNNFFQNSQT
jgi:hypothetical protein